MANSYLPATPHRSVKVSDALWTRAGIKCERLGLTRTDVIVAALEKFVDGDEDRGKGPAAGAPEPHR
jgi:hypothetical protein